MSRPDRVFVWYVHTVLALSLIRRGDMNVAVDGDVAELVHYRATKTADMLNSTQMTRFRDRIIERLRSSIDLCLLHS